MEDAPVLLIVGGELDPNIAALVQQAERSGVPHVALLVGNATSPRLEWGIAESSLTVDGRRIEPDAVFVRFDVFASLADGRPEVSDRAAAWYATAWGYALSRSDVRVLNRHATPLVGNKPATLARARAAGLRVPRTAISSDAATIGARAELGPWIAKPVAGGDYCRPLGTVVEASAPRDGAFAQPAIIQERLVPPEVRIYRFGDELRAFDMSSPSLDYRVKQDATVTPIDVPEAEGRGLVALMDGLGMDFGAADFKTDPESGQLMFLEVNSSPMFAHFDTVSEGEVTRCLLRALLG